MTSTIAEVKTAKAETVKIQTETDAVVIDMILDAANSFREKLESLCVSLEKDTESLLADPEYIPNDAADIIKQCKAVHKLGIKLFDKLRNHGLYKYIKSTVLHYGHVLDNYREAVNDAEKLCITYPNDTEFASFIRSL